MSEDKMIAIIVASGCTNHDARKYVKNGSVIYESTPGQRYEFIREMVGIGFDTREAVDMWYAMDTAEYEGDSYRIDFAL